MAVTAWKTCGNAVNDTASGTAIWADDPMFGSTLSATVVQSDDNFYARAQAGGSARTHWLKCTQFGFSGTDVPSGAGIDGIEIEVRHYRSGAAAVATTHWCPVIGGALAGAEQNVSGDWATSEAATVYGGAADKGGASPSQADVVASTFGVAIATTAAASRLAESDANRHVDQVRMRVYYTEGAGGGGGATPTVAQRRRSASPNASM